MKEVYLVYSSVRRTEDEYQDLEIFDNLASAIKWYKREVNNLKEKGGLLYDFQSWGYKEKYDYQISDDPINHGYFLYTIDGYYEASVYIKTKYLRK